MKRLALLLALALVAYGELSGGGSPIMGVYARTYCIWGYGKIDRDNIAGQECLYDLAPWLMDKP